MFSQTSCSSGNAATLHRISNAAPCMLNTRSLLSSVCLGRQLSFRQLPRQSWGSRQSSCVYAKALYGLVLLLLAYMGIWGCWVGAGSTVPRLNRRCGCVGFIAEVVKSNGSKGWVTWTQRRARRKCWSVGGEFAIPEVICGQKLLLSANYVALRLIVARTFACEKAGDGGSRVVGCMRYWDRSVTLCLGIYS